MFFTLPKTNINFLDTSNLWSADTFNLDRSKILPFGKELTPPKQALVFMCLQYKSFENTMEKGEIAHDVSHSVFYPSREILPYSSNLKLSSANSFNLEEFKICRSGKG